MSHKKNLTAGLLNIDEIQTEKFLLFTSNNLLFGVTAEFVVEILTSFSITKVPLVPDFIKGIINLRGQILPILSTSDFLPNSTSENDEKCIIILTIQGTSIGVLVDTVERMLDVNADSILPSPRQYDSSIVSQMAALPDGKTMLIFDSLQMLNLS